MVDHPQLRLDAQLCFPLYAAARAVTREYAALLEGTGLTYPQYLVMLVLWEAQEPLGVGQLGERLRLDSGTLTPLLKRLEAAGQLTRQRSTDDERRVMIELTPAGRALERKILEVPTRLQQAVGFSDKELRGLRDQLNQLLDRLG